MFSVIGPRSAHLPSHYIYQPYVLVIQNHLFMTLMCLHIEAIANIEEALSMMRIFRGVQVMIHDWMKAYRMMINKLRERGGS